MLAKITRPRLHQVYANQRLLTQLASSRSVPCIWLSSPPGAGKTTLVANYLAIHKTPAVWYQVDRGDRDPSSMFHHLALGLEQPRFKKIRPQLPGGRELELGLFAQSYFRDYFSAFPKQGMLILDNWQDAADNDALVNLTLAAIDALPESISLLVISRQPPPPDFSRHLANRKIAQISWNDLRLHDDEVAGMLQTLSQQTALTPAELNLSIDGWAAGLILLAGTGSKNTALPALADNSKQHVFNYFAQEFFNPFDPKQQRVLMAASLLPSFSAGMASRLSGVKESKNYFHAMEQHHLFLSAHGTRPDYRFHPLFADFLRNEMRRRLEPKEQKQLTGQAVDLLMQDGQTIAALDLLIEEQQFESAAALVLQFARGMLESGQWRTLDNILRQIPTEAMSVQPWLIYWQARAKMAHDTGGALNLFEQAYALFTTAENARGRWLSAAGAVETIYLEYERQSRFEPWCDFFLAEYPQLPQFANPEDELFVYTQIFTALKARRLDHPLVAELEKKLSRLVAQPCSAEERILAAASLLEYYTHGSMVGEGKAIGHLIEPLVEKKNIAPSTQVLWGLRYGFFLRFSDPQKSDAMLGSMRDYAKRHGDRKGINDAIQVEVMNALTVRDLPRSRALIEEEERMLNPNSYLDRGFYLFDVACLALLENQLDVAETKFHESLRLTALAEIDHAELLAMKPQLGATFLKQGRIDEAVELFRDLQTASISKRYYIYETAIDLCQAHGAFRASDPTLGVSHLRHALQTSREQDALHVLMLAPDIMAELMCRALEYDCEAAQALAIIRYQHLSPPEDSSEAWPWPLKIYTLGRFEIVKDGAALQYSRKAPHRLLAALKALIAYGAQDVAESRLADSLWPDESGETARDTLATTLHRLRKLLGDSDALLVQEGKISLNPERVWIDAQAFEHTTQVAGQSSDRILQLYRGAFLPGDADASWSVIMRERLRGKFIRTLKQHTGRLIEENKHELAIEYFQRGIDADSLTEDFYQGQMRAYLALGRHAEGLAVYRRLRQNLSVILGIAPSAETETLRLALQNSPLNNI